MSRQFLGPQAMKHLFEHQQAEPQEPPMPHQVIPHLTIHVGGMFHHVSAWYVAILWKVFDMSKHPVGLKNMLQLAHRICIGFPVHHDYV